MKGRVAHPRNSLIYRIVVGVLFLGVGGIGPLPAWGIQVNLTLEEAKQILASGREPMEKAKGLEDVARIFKASEKPFRVGADPEQERCGTSAILKTKHYWLEYFGRREAAESKRQNRTIRMPEDKIRDILAMPNLEIELWLCGQEEFFAEGVDVALQQGSRNIMPVDKGKPSRGRRIPGSDSDYVSRFSARFAYDDFDPNAKTNIVVFFPDGKLITLEADFSKIQ
ncbi:MAG: hypothetical protein D6704_06525 [Nitrospirae bacterium]|nr:MAG: hypothetical protein D6704_06525 [Nitrospirota bacterium]